MPLILIPFGLILLLAVIALSLPFSIVRRYKMGTARRLARLWVAAVNAFGLGFSALLFLGTAAITSAWVSEAFNYSALGLAAGVVLGLIGVALTRWEQVPPHSLYYTPNRWLVLAITVGVALRLTFGFWRAWHAWDGSSGEHSWLAESGFAGSMGAGAVVLGYYLAFWRGVWSHVAKHQRLVRSSSQWSKLSKTR